MAHAARHAAVFADGLIQAVADHGRFALGLEPPKLLVDHTEGVHTIVIVGVDDDKRLADAAPRTEHGVPRAEGLGALRRNGIECRHAGKVLIGIADLDRRSVRRRHAGDAPAAERLHQLTHFGLDDEHHLGKARADRVVDGVFHQNFAVGTDAVYLLAAAVARAHARRHNDQCRFHRRSSSCVEIFFIIAHLSSVFNFFPSKPCFLAANCYTVCVNKFF